MRAEDRVAEALAALAARGISGRFDCALVLGTGLSQLADDVADAVSVPFGEVPHLAPARVTGHEGRIVAGRYGRRRVLVFQGRVHFYEAGDAAAMAVPIGIVAALGAPPLILTSAAGAVNPGLPVGGLVLVCDHINYSGLNPLLGETGDARFVPMVGAYDAGLRADLTRAAAAAEVPLPEGVYMWFSGPSFETPAEIRMAGLLGADLVGMSTVPEVILARFHGLRVAAISAVTNMAAGIGDSPLAHTHAETNAAAAAAAPKLRRVLRAYLSGRDDD
ncbi:purine-nucleoside phosphorylase [Enterovirga rhinocerotis]|uniref:Purine nucleoside phosphorylase n=1 Tax=Enterovirga rhinocerotis TaxID=1339210 RepID=A0A4R7BXA8_9HYPH|nr:purine-nucleoside phosphorylase [Enterovirga rhinocerotis]TDR90143.1 purine-nucleoside phosphorylase [Enterovirga rhinocerotis]